MRTRRGVTLIEMLIAMSVVSVVLIAVLNVFNVSQRLFDKQVGRSESIAEANLAMDLMCKEISSSIIYGTDVNGDIYFIPPATTDASGNYLPIRFGGVLFYYGTTAVKFYPSDAGGGNWGSNTGDSSTGTYLWRSTTTKLNGNPKWQADDAWSTQPGGQTPKFPNISSLVFTTAGLPANTIQVSLTVKTKEGGQSSNYTVTRIVYLQNHD